MSLHMSMDFSKNRSALVMAHPGHELRVYQWLRLTRPLCFVLTNGSGRSGKSRLDSTTKLLEQNDARIGSIYGRLTDQAIYSAIIKREFNLFIDLTAELARQLVGEKINYVVGDAREGYNPTHDVCRFMINAAVEIASRQIGEPIMNLEVFLTGESEKASQKIDDEIVLDLDEESVSLKLEAARGYPEIAADVDQILQEEGIHAIQTERLRPVADLARNGFGETPYYEIHGAKQVEMGFYQQVLRYSEHVRPLEEALRCYSQQGCNPLFSMS